MEDVTRYILRSVVVRVRFSAAKAERARAPPFALSLYLMPAVRIAKYPAKGGRAKTPQNETLRLFLFGGKVLYEN